MKIKKRYQVFVSSTYEDLEKERKKVMSIISKNKLCHPVGMEIFTAASRSQWDYIKEVIDDSDIYILIIGERYGEIDKETGMSWTRKEYEYAKEQAKPIYSFLRKQKNDDEKLNNFRKIVEGDGKMADYWTSADDLASKIASSLVTVLENPPPGGWIKSESIINDTAPQKSTITFIDRSTISLVEQVKTARYDVFISGSTLTSIPSNLVDVLKDNNNISFRFLTLDYEDIDCINQFCKMAGKGLVYDDMKLQNDSFKMFLRDSKIRDNPLIEVKKTNRVLPLAYVGIDVFNFSDTSHIKVQQYLHEKSGYETVNYIVQSEHKLFPIYETQIKTLWSMSKDY
jgi:hypothetical protein